MKSSPEGAGGGAAALENEADELLTEVLDRLRADDFRALREFRGGAKITTYMTAIISNLVVDLVRQRKGRCRARERAQDMGEVAERLYELVYTRGCSLQEAHSHLEVNFGITEQLHNLQQMLHRMQGRERVVAVGADDASSWLVPGRQTVVDGEVELVVTDPRPNAESSLISHQKSAGAQAVVAALVGELTGEERFMFRLRFPADEDDEPRSIKEIAALLGLPEKAVDARIRRILLRFREKLLGQGLSLQDLIDV